MSAGYRIADRFLIADPDRDLAATVEEMLIELGRGCPAQPMPPG